MADGTAGDPAFERMFEHQAWVRALALRLCSDADDAADVAQTTWLEALRTQSRPRDVRKWLAGVVRHVARSSRRERIARGVHEPRGELASDVPSAESLLAHAELQRKILAAVAGLPESMRTVVLLRYYEGLTPEAIALKLGAPGATVRARLARALAKLREKLDGEYGSRSAWSVFAPLSAIQTSATGVATGIGVAVKVQIAVAAAAVLVAALFVWNLRPVERAATAEAPRPNVVDSPAVAATDNRSEAAPAEERRAIAGDAKSTVDRILVWGELHGATADALKQGSFAFVDELGASRDVSLGAPPSYSIFGLRPGKYRALAQFRGCLPLDEDLALPDNTPKLRHDFELKPALVLPVKLATRDGRPLELSHGLASAIAVVATSARPARIADVYSRHAFGSELGYYYSKQDAIDDASFPDGCSGVLEVHGALPLFASLALRSAVLETRAISGGERELVFVIDPAELETKLGALTVRCVDAATGQPIAGARVEVTSIDVGGGESPCDASGVARAGKLAPGMLGFTAEAPGHAEFHRYVRIDPGETLDLGTVELRATATIRGRVVDAQGKGVSMALSVIALDHFSSAREADTNMSSWSEASGAFSIDWAERGRVRLLGETKNSALAVLDVDASSGVVEGVELKLKPAVDVSIRLERGTPGIVNTLLVDSAGLPLAFFGLHSMSTRRIRLEPGRYELRSVVENEVVATRAFEVGSEPVAIVSSGSR